MNATDYWPGNIFIVGLNKVYYLKSLGSARKRTPPLDPLKRPLYTRLRRDCNNHVQFAFVL